MAEQESRDMQALRDEVVAAIDAATSDILNVSRFIHAHPEVAMEEVHSAAAVADTLGLYGFTVTRAVANIPTAFRAECGQGQPCIAYLAEYDALPGLGHACGHNLIAAAGDGRGHRPRGGRRGGAGDGGCLWYARRGSGRRQGPDGEGGRVRRQ